MGHDLEVIIDICCVDTEPDFFVPLRVLSSLLYSFRALFLAIEVQGTIRTLLSYVSFIR